MMGKRKRGHPVQEEEKRAKVKEESIIPVRHPTLGLYYRNVLTLKDYMLSKLPTTSKTRRRKIASILPDTTNSQQPDENTNASSQGRHCLSKLLNNTLVCTVREQTPRPESARIENFEAFSQHAKCTAASSLGGSTSSLPDLVDYAIWLLFHEIHRRAHRPPHMLCHGFQRCFNPRQISEDHCPVAGIPGLVSYYPNANVNALKGSLWREVLGLLGKEGDRIVLDLILDSGIFVAGDEGLNNYYQLSGRSYPGRPLDRDSSLSRTGTPLTDLQPLSGSSFRTHVFSKPDLCNASISRRATQSMRKKPAAILFVRHRMFYARAALNAKGRVTFGLRHIRGFGNFASSYRLIGSRCPESIPRCW